MKWSDQFRKLRERGLKLRAPKLGSKIPSPAISKLREKLGPLGARAKVLWNQLQIRMHKGGNQLSTGIQKLPSLPNLAKRIPIFFLPAVFVGGILAADLAWLLVAQSFLKPRSGLPAIEPRVVTDAPHLRSRITYEELVRRNPFCPGCPVPPLEKIRAERKKDCNRARVLGSGPKLIGTIALSDPRFSVATLSDGGTEATAVKVGESFRSIGVVFEIRRDRVCFESSDGNLSYIPLPEEEIRFGQPIASNLSPSRFEGITKTSETEVEIKRSFLIEKLADPTLLFQAQAVADRDENGNIRGFKVMNITPGSVFEATGIKNDDVILAVNGEPMTSPTKAQQLYSGARDADEVNIEVLRGGQVVKLNFKVK
jgi:type II secretion system protein C